MKIPFVSDKPEPVMQSPLHTLCGCFIKGNSMAHKKKLSSKKKKIKIVMTEFKEGKLRSGSKQGPKVTNPKQAIAIAISESKKIGKKKKKTTKKK